MRRPSRQGQSAMPLLHDIVAHAISSFLLICLLADRALAQNLDDDVNAYFEALNEGAHPRFPDVPPETSAEALANFYKAIRPHLQNDADAGMDLRLKALALVAFVSSRVHNADARINGVQLLMNACTRGDFRQRSLAIDLLTHFKPPDFSNTAKDTLRKLIRSEAAPLDRIFRLAGFVRLPDLEDTIKPYSQPGHPSHIRWAAIVTLARLGDKSAIHGMMQRVKRIPVNDDVVYRVFPDLIYTRQPDAVAYIVEALQSNAKNCRTADAERDMAIPCGYRVMEQLAPIIEGFPVALDASGDLATDDYPAALQQVRQWFSTSTTYEIRNDTY